MSEAREKQTERTFSMWQITAAMDRVGLHGVLRVMLLNELDDSTAEGAGQGRVVGELANEDTINS